MSIFFLMPIIAGMAIFPFISHARISDNLRKIHQESREQKEIRREQFRQDVLEKRREVLLKWSDRKQDFKEKLNEERRRVKSEFERYRLREEAEKNSAEIMEIPNQGISVQKQFSSLIKSAQDIAQFFPSLNELFEDV